MQEIGGMFSEVAENQWLHRVRIRHIRVCVPVNEEKEPPMEKIKNKKKKKERKKNPEILAVAALVKLVSPRAVSFVF